VAITPDGKYFIHCGNWDSSIVVSSATDTSQSFYISEHKDVVTCLAITADGSKLVTGSKDCNCFIWDMDSVIKALKQKDKASVCSAAPNHATLISHMLPSSD
jgi:WD40 repeat protein